jgi:hypothetical protein
LTPAAADRVRSFAAQPSYRPPPFIAMKLVAVYFLSLALFAVISAAHDDPEDEEMVKFKEFKVIIG